MLRSRASGPRKQVPFGALSQYSGAREESLADDRETSILFVVYELQQPWQNREGRGGFSARRTATAGAAFAAARCLWLSRPSLPMVAPPI